MFNSNRLSLVAAGAAVIASLLVGGEAKAVTFNFTKVIDTNTLIPGGSGNFTSLGSPSLDGGNVAFRGSSNSLEGIYTDIGGSLNVVADTRNVLPGATGVFPGFSDPSLSGSNVAFTANSIRGCL